MKHFKFLTLFVFFISIGSALAQQTAKNQDWPALANTKAVMTRIATNLEQNNPAAFSFSKTLMNQTKALTKTEIPATYKNGKNEQSAKRLITLAESIHTKYEAKAPQQEITKLFSEYKTLLESIVPNEKK